MLQEIERVQRLIDHDTAALLEDLASPGAGLVIGLVALPAHKPQARLNAVLTDEIDEPEHAGLKTVLLANAKLRTTLLLCLQNGVQLLHGGSQGLFTQNVNAALQCRDRHWGVQIVRCADVDGIGLFFV